MIVVLSSQILYICSSAVVAARNKAGGINGILLEMVTVCSYELIYLFNLLNSVWDSESVAGSGEMPPWLLYLRREVCPHVARHAISDIPPDVVGKFFVKTVLYCLLDEEVADFQCKHGCIDVLFVHAN